MENSNKTKEYSNGEMTIIWEPGKCFHSGVCTKMLPKVYRPEERPWIQIENATTEELKDQVSQCPSGALTYYMNKEGKPKSADEVDVKVMKDGPLLVTGTLKVTNADGITESKTQTTAFCRCGASKNKPYCDGSHTKAGFEG
jgi:uncharacterized Fe-S cluster protein YjdI